MNNTLVKGLQLLELIARNRGPMGVSELAEQLSLGKSNVHRLLQGLVELGYVTKEEDRGTYQATLKLWELGNAMDMAMTLKTAAAEAMNQLLSCTRETVHLSILEGTEVLYLAKIDSPEPVRAYSEVGGRAPAHCVATGKALLAWRPLDVLENFARHLEKHTSNTITNTSEFLQEMERIRSSGYAVNRGEWRETVWGVAAPILNRQSVAVGAVGVSGPSSRIKTTQIRSLAEAVLTAAQSISARLSPA